MAKDTSNKGTAQNKADQSLLDALLGQGGSELRLERCIYAADDCGDVPLVGFIVDILDMPPIDMGKDGKRDWQAFVFKTTHATKGKDREGNVVGVEAGEEVITPATFQIAAALGRFAKDPNVMHEIGLQPKEKLDIGGGKNFWTYRVIRVSRDKGKTYSTEPRGTQYALSDGGAKAPAQLPSADGTHNVNTKTGEAVPVAPASAS